MIEVTGLSKSYGSFLAVDHVGFRIEDGEIVGFLGPNGAGKSTIMNMLTGYLSPTTGQVCIDGYDILEQPREAKMRIGYLPEIPPLYPDMTVREYLQFMFELKKVSLPKAPHLEEICRLVKIDDVEERLIKNLSKGYRQRVGIAQALIGNPDVLILDEPTVGLDPKQIIEIRNLIIQLGRQHTVILSSHILSEIQAICQRIIIVNRGKLVADGTEEDLAKHLAQDSRIRLRVRGSREDADRALQALTETEWQYTGETEPGACDYMVYPQNGADVRAALADCLFKSGLTLLELHSSRPTLEELFLQLTQEPEAEPVEATDEAPEEAISAEAADTDDETAAIGSADAADLPETPDDDSQKEEL